MFIFFIGLLIFLFPKSIIDLTGAILALICIIYALTYVYKLIWNKKNAFNFYILPIFLGKKLSILSCNIEKILEKKSLRYKKIENKSYFNPYYMIYYLIDENYFIRIQESDIGKYEYIQVGPKLNNNIGSIEEIKNELEKVLKKINIDY